MQYKLYSHRYGVEIANFNENIKLQFEELKYVIESITDEELIRCFEESSRVSKSLADTFNKIIKERLVASNWNSESFIFSDELYKRNGNWRLDFAKDDISVEVAFNHGEAVAWNLIKPVLASELNHIRKEINTKLGVVICATNELKRKGGFDGATGTYDKFIEYCKAMTNILTTPLIIIGIEAPTSFEIAHEKVDNKNIGRVVRN